jgi:hypothetical protein
MTAPNGLFSDGAVPTEASTVSVMPAAVAPVGETAVHVSTFVPPMAARQPKAPTVAPIGAPAIESPVAAPLAAPVQTTIEPPAAPQIAQTAALAAAPLTEPRPATAFATLASPLPEPKFAAPLPAIAQAIPSSGLRQAQSSRGTWTLVPLVLGLAAIAVCVVFPQIDANRRLDYERQKLVADLDQINRQTALNEEFLGKIEIDPQLAQRLAQRQMKFIRQGESVLPYKPRSTGSGVTSPLSAAQESPFSLVRVPPPPAQAPYQPAGGIIGEAMLDSHFRLYCLAGGLFLVAVSLVLGSNDDHAPRPCP